MDAEDGRRGTRRRIRMRAHVPAAQCPAIDAERPKTMRPLDAFMFGGRRSTLFDGDEARRVEVLLAARGSESNAAQAGAREFAPDTFAMIPFAATKWETTCAWLHLGAKLDADRQQAAERYYRQWFDRRGRQGMAGFGRT